MTDILVCFLVLYVCLSGIFFWFLLITTFDDYSNLTNFVQECSLLKLILMILFLPSSILFLLLWFLGIYLIKFIYFACDTYPFKKKNKGVNLKKDGK